MTVRFGGHPMRMTSALALFALAATAIIRPAHADIERKAIIDCEKQQICFYIWPSLPDVSGWHGEEDANYQVDANLRIPDGHTFADSDVILCGNAVAHEPPGSGALDAFILDDEKMTREDNPGAVFSEQEPLSTADGRKLRTFVISKLKRGHTQMISYTEDGDKDGKFVIILMVDSGNEKDFNASVPAFREMVSKYKHFSGAN